MNTQYGIRNIPPLIAYNNLATNFKRPRLYEPLRIRLGKSHKYIADDHIYDWTEFMEAKQMKDLMRKLPDYLLEVGFEFGIELKSINNRMAYDGVIDFRQKRIRIKVEDFETIKSAGCYEPGARLVVISKKYLSEKDKCHYNPLAYFMGKGFQHAILSNKDLIKIPEHIISYDNRFLPYYVIRYALRKGQDYFAKSLEKFVCDNKFIELKEDDRPMFRFLEMLFGKHKSTMNEEELTGIEYVH